MASAPNTNRQRIIKSPECSFRVADDSQVVAAMDGDVARVLLVSERLGTATIYSTNSLSDAEFEASRIADKLAGGALVVQVNASHSLFGDTVDDLPPARPPAPKRSTKRATFEDAVRAGREEREAASEQASR